jgi:hypothetical protein
MNRTDWLSVPFGGEIQIADVQSDCWIKAVEKEDIVHAVVTVVAAAGTPTLTVDRTLHVYLLQ